jgi:hypothetical protein
MDSKQRQYVLVESEESTRHIWAVADHAAKLAAHLWIHIGPSGDPYGGIEWHMGNKRSHHDDKPSHEHCWLLQSPCWHDGSSLAAERWCERFKQDGMIENVAAWNYLSGLIERQKEDDTNA